MSNLSRTTALKIAAGLSFVLSALSVAGALPLIAQGAANSGAEAPPYAVILLGLITGIVGMVAAFGAWKGQRWGVILTILANLLNGLAAAPGVLFAPTTGWWLAASVTVAASIVIIVLCLWPDRRQPAAA